MINLLPPRAKKQVRTEYWLRVFTVACFAIALALIMVVVMVAPVYISVQSDISRISSSVQSAEQQSAAIEMNAKIVKEANQEVQYLLSEAITFPMNAYITAIENQAGTGIQIVDIAMSRTEDGSVNTIQVGAVGDSRQAVLDFLDTLSAQEAFGVIEVPLSSLAQSEKIEFSIVIPVLDTTEANNSPTS